MGVRVAVVCCSIGVVILAPVVPAFSIHAVFPRTNTAASTLYMASPPPSSSKRLIPTKSKLTPAQRILIQNQSTNNNGSNNDLPFYKNFDQLKSMVYTVSDGIKSPRNTGPSGSAKVLDGYTDRRTQQQPSPTNLFSSFSFQSPLSASTATKSQVSPNTNIPVSQPLSLSVFDTLKSTFYNSVDFAANASPKNKSTTTSGGKNRLNSFQPITKLSLTKTTTSTSSKNPVFQALSEWKMRNRQANVQAIQESELMTNPFLQLKERLYSMNDNVSRAIQHDIPAIPQQLQRTTTETITTIQSIPLTIQETIDGIRSIPNQVQETTLAVQRKFDTSIQQTTQWIENVQNIPNQVQQSMDQTQETMQSTQQSLNDLYTSTKVWLRMEPPQPKPPVLQPPPPTNMVTEVAWTTAQTIARSTGQLVVWMGQNAMDYYQNNNQQQPSVPISNNNSDTKGMTDKKTMTSTMAATAASITTQEPVPSTISSASSTYVPNYNVLDTTDLDREIAEALQLAEEALALASATTSIAPTTIKTTDESSTTMMKNQEVDVLASATSIAPTTSNTMDESSTIIMKNQEVD
jgi:hypothetical protein